MIQYNMVVRRPTHSLRARPVTPLDSALPQSPARKPFRINTSIARPDLRIPKDLPRLNFRSQLLYILHLPLPSHKCGKQTTYNPFRICTYGKCARNSFRIRTYKKKPGGCWLPIQFAPFPNIPTFKPCNLQTSPVRDRASHTTERGRAKIRRLSLE